MRTAPFHVVIAPLSKGCAILYPVLLAVAPPPAGIDPVAAAPVKFSILIEQPKPACDRQSGDEIVVCADPDDPERHRLRPIPHAERFENQEGLPKAEVALGENSSMAAEVDSAEMAGGVVSKRIMVRLKVKF